MEPVEIPSFNKKDGKITLFEDKEGKSPAVVIPVWMFNQMVETLFGVEVNDNQENS